MNEGLCTILSLEPAAHFLRSATAAAALLGLDGRLLGRWLAGLFQANSCRFHSFCPPPSYPCHSNFSMYDYDDLMMKNYCIFRFQNALVRKTEWSASLVPHLTSEAAIDA